MIKNYIPNLLTFANLSFGVLSILETINHNFALSAIYILLAALIDRYDGKIARYLGVNAEIGTQLDSLADLVSFGVASALLLYYKFSFHELYFANLVGLWLLLLYIISGCYRLARYNTMKSEGAFCGVPITLAGSFLSMYALAIPSNRISALLALALLLILSLLMISTIRIRKM